MKNFLKIACVGITLAFTGCQDQLLLEDELQMQQQALEIKEGAQTNLETASASGQSALEMNGLPELTLKKNQKGNYRLVIKDANIADIDSTGKGKITLVARKGDEPIEEVSFTWGSIKRIMSIPMPQGTPSFSARIMNAKIEYFNAAGKSTKLYDYDVYVFADGTTALQRPAFKAGNNGVIGRWTFDDGHGLDHSIVVENDPAFEVSVVKVTFNEPFGGPAPLVTSYVARLNTDQPRLTTQDRSYVFRVEFDPDQNPVGSTYSVTAAMLNAKGETLGDPLTTNVVVQKADFKGRIRRVRVRQEGDGSNEYKAIVVVENATPFEVAKTEIVFNEPFVGPKPLHGRWDGEYDDGKPWEWSSSQDIFKYAASGQFSGNAAGYTYNVTATMKDFSGRTVGQPLTMDVVVEGKKADEPVILSSTLTSKDKGLTWDIVVTLEDKGQWVEKVVYEFAKPYAGPAPLVNPITLVRTGEASGNVEVYTATGIKFEKNPVGFTYGGLIYQFGIGTRSTASQANNKAELL